MSNIQNRPYAGTWKLNNRSVVKYTPDALVFLNGDTSLPGCARCRGRIEIQKFVTGLSVEAGTEPTSHSATINLALPRVHGQQVFIDGYNILRPGLEVHIFMRGYFPIRGMFSHLSNPQAGPDGDGAPTDSSRLDLTKYATYPYYPVFHGLITQVSYEYSDGFYYGTLNCSSLLHFWQYVNMTTSAAQMGTRPTNDPSRPTLYGHSFNNMHPYAIMYTLYKDIAGAAAGVDFSLSKETNHNAVAAGTGNDGRQIYDMVSLYWEQRFKTRIQNLRMYGVNGQLFNAAQQAWLGQNRDVKGLIPSATANDPTTTRTAKDPFAARTSIAKALGLQGAGADFTYSPLIQQDDELFNLSVLDMFAFNQTVGDIGNVNIWQSTYQTKMQIAQQVMEVTGYEFYQDVDGDLVFKPPFWNLDTAPNRYYRLEDSDIINITFTEKEAVATYILVRGVWFGGLSDVASNKDEMDKRGMYVDYKLVAKFGWRPAPSLELTYVTDPKVLFWIGVARLDMLNVDTFSASATIPIRAELRPGFPVYIPFVDSYYYITQLSHSFAFAGQCTTSLVLTCRRSKWHAPGFLKAPTEGDSAISLIRLDRPDLPPRPLEVFVNDIPRIVGFPNVVMALDPRKFNPNFSAVGVGIEYFDAFDKQTSADLLFGLIVRDIHNLEAFTIDVPAQGADGKSVIEDPTLVTSLKLTVDGQADISFTVDDLVEYFGSFKDSQKPINEGRSKVGTAGDKLTEADSSSDAFKLTKGGLPNPEPSSARRTAASNLAQAEAEEQGILANQTGVLKTGKLPNLVQIFLGLQPDSNRPIRRNIDGISGSDVRFSYFETLSHLKGQYMAASVPGHYRYFSCSHPNPFMQGMPLISWNDGKRAKSPAPKTERRSKKRTPRTPGTPGTPAPRRGRRGGSGRTQQGQRIFDVDAATQQRFDRDARELNARLSERGVTWIDAEEILYERNIGSTTGKLSRSQVRAKSPDGPTMDNLANIAQAVQELENRLALRKEFQGGAEVTGEGATVTSSRLFLIKTSAFRVGSTVEGSGKQSQHDLGLAMDLQIGGTGAPSQKGGTPVSDLPEPYRSAYLALKEEAGKMWAEGLFSGYGFYEDRATGGSNLPFVHVDLRKKRVGNWAEVSGIPSYKADASIVKGCKANVPASEVDACILQARGLLKEAKARKDAQVKASLKAADRTSRATTQRYPLDVPDSPSPEPVAAPEPEPLGVFESAAQAAAQAFEAAKARLTPDPPPEPGAAPSITTFDVQLEIPRTVVQFKKEVTQSDGALRHPEVEIGVGRCVNGIQIALGPNRAPLVVTTDQIQRVTFVRHQVGKFTQVVGNSQSSGTVSLKGTSLTMRIADYFKTAIQNLKGPDQTLKDLYGDLYDNARRELFGGGEDQASVDARIPVYKEGKEVGSTQIAILPFDDALKVEADLIPQSVIDELNSLEGAEDADSYSVSEFTLKQLSQVAGYISSVNPQAGGQGYQRTAEAAAAYYAARVVKYLESGNGIEGGLGGVDPGTGEGISDTPPWVGFLALQKAANPDDQGGTQGQKVRQDDISQAFSKALDRAFGAAVGGSFVDGVAAIVKAVNEGKIEKPIHSPVFPVSDEKGYEHYGAYRYGRGLSIQPGGTWEFLHSGQDPFKNVTTQSAEEFLRVFTLVKEGRIGGGALAAGAAASAASGAVVGGAQGIKAQGIKAALSAALEFVLGIKQDALENSETDDPNAAPKTFEASLSDTEKTQIDTSVLELARVVAQLGKTARGNDVLRELLRANGDDPNLLDADGGFDLSQTQFLRNFVNYSVNFGKSPVFKTTASNAAYRLADLTTHLLDRAGPACICRGALADVEMEAYARKNFNTVDGVDTATQKAEAYAGEQAKSQAEPHATHQQRERGQISKDEGTGAGQSAPASTTGAGQSGVVSTTEDAGTVSPENPPTTAEGPTAANPTDPNDFGFSDSASAREALGIDPSLDDAAAAAQAREELSFFEKTLDVPEGGLQRILEEEGPEGVRKFLAERALSEGFGGNDDKSSSGGGRNIDRALGVSAEQLLAALYLDSRQIQPIPAGTEVPAGGLPVPPLDSRSEVRAAFEEESGLTIEQMLAILESNNKEAIDDLLTRVDGARKNRFSEKRLRKELEEIIRDEG